MATFADLARRFTVENIPTSDERTRALWLHQWYTRAMVQVNLLPGVDAIVPNQVYREIVATRNDLNQKADGILGVAGSVVPATLGIRTSYNTLRDIMTAGFIAAADGAPAHWSPTNVATARQLLGPEKFAQDYQARLALFQAVAKIGESGVMRLFPEAQQSELQSGTVHALNERVARSMEQMKGLGAIPVVPAGILIAIVAVIVGIAAIIAYYFFAAENNKELHKDLRLCVQLVNASESQKELCNKLADGAQKSWADDIPWVIGLVVAGALAVNFLPQITGSIMSARRTAREAPA